MGGGAATFPASIGYAAGAPRGIVSATVYGAPPYPLAVGDIDGDGKPDIVHAGATDGVMLLRNTTH